MTESISMNIRLFKRDPELDPIDLSQTYTLLHPTGDVEKVKGGEEFWKTPRSIHDRVGQHWLFSEQHYQNDWKEWKMHPAGDEIIYLLDGSINVIIEQANLTNTLKLRSSGVVTIPRQVWYRIEVLDPCHVLNISRELNTKHRQIDEIESNSL